MCTIFFTRSSSVPKCVFGKELYLYKYNQLFKFKHNNLKTGHKLGEFFFTRKPFLFPQKPRGKNSKKKKAIKR
jgi:ribosomal protein S19